MLLSLNSSLQQVHNSLIDLANSMTGSPNAQGHPVSMARPASIPVQATLPDNAIHAQPCINMSRNATELGATRRPQRTSLPAAADLEHRRETSSKGSSLDTND